MPDGEFEAQLRDALAPVAAPEELWDCVSAPRAAARANLRINWLLAAVAMLALMAGTVWQFRSALAPAIELRGIAMREAADRRLDIRTSDCAKLRDWLHHTAALDVPLPAHTRAELVGARVVRGSGAERIAAILYRVAGSAVTLFVRRGATPGGHTGAHLAAMDGADLYSWSLRGNTYAMVAPASVDGHDGCRLCHAW